MHTGTSNTRANARPWGQTEGVSKTTSATDIRCDKENDMLIIKVTKWIELGQGENSQDPMLSQMTEYKYAHTIA